MRVVAVIPAYNEESRVAEAIADAALFVDEVVVVDDCSLDNTHLVASSAGVHVLRHIVNRGQGAALQTGTEYALSRLSADIIVHFDADGQMTGEDIETMIEPIKTGEADVVLGSRNLGQTINMPFSRRLMKRGALWFTFAVSGIRVTDTHTGFRAFSRHAAENIRITLDRMAHPSEILDLIKVKKLRFVERPVTIRYSEETLAKGMSNFDAIIVVKDYFIGKFFDEL